MISKLNFFIIIVLAFLNMNCNTRKIDVQGHRGCRGLFPENSLPAFEKAITLGVNTLELDLAISKDKKVVVSHEPFISRTYCLDCNAKTILEHDDLKYNIYKMHYDSIRLFDCGSRFYKRFPNQEKIKVYKPLLGDVFLLSKQKKSKIKFNIEIKSTLEYDNVFAPEPQEFVRLVLKEIKKYNMFNRVNLQSFDIRVLDEIKKQAPTMAMALLVDEGEDIWTKLATMHSVPEIISPYYKLLDLKVVEKLRLKNFKIIPWTLNDKDQMKEMIQLKVDGIITDYPDQLIEILKH